MRFCTMVGGIVGLVLSLGAEQTLGQAFNIDFQPTEAATPPPTFGGAAGQTGQWMSSAFAFNQVLTTVDGEASLATMRVFLQGGSNWMSGPVSNTGAHADLLDDGIMATTTQCIGYGFINMRVDGVANGVYDVYTYAAWPVSTWGSADIDVVGSSETKHISGAMPGDSFVEGVTHTVHRVTISGGVISIYVSPTEAPWEAFLAGVQIVPVDLVGCEITQQPSSQSVLKEQTVVFSAAVSGDVRSYQWLKDGAPLPNGRGISGATTATLTLTEARPSDEGEYVLRYRCGSTYEYTAGATLSVTECPGDVDGDGDVDLSDLSRLLAYFGASCL